MAAGQKTQSFKTELNVASDVATSNSTDLARRPRPGGPNEASQKNIGDLGEIIFPETPTPGLASPSNQNTMKIY